MNRCELSLVVEGCGEISKRFTVSDGCESTCKVSEVSSWAEEIQNFMTYLGLDWKTAMTAYS